MTKEEFLSKKVALITLGCDKNTVDAERMMFLLSSYGFEFVSDIEKANIVIVNTCAFILSSKQESIEKIFEVAKYKSQNLEKLIVTGCLSQRYYDEVNTMQEVDACVRLKNNEKIVEIIAKLYGYEGSVLVKEKEPNRIISTPSHYAFLKIADGCNNFCSFCSIPFIRGIYKSTPMEELILEAKALAKKSIKELLLVAQDVTNYGTDLYGSPKLVELLQELSKIKDIKWIRLHYCYPNLITDELIEEIEHNEKICKYLDIPLQHISDEILKNMKRKDKSSDIKLLLDKLQHQEYPISIRSTFIVGFPGETKKQFNELVDFLKEYKLDNVGFFTYSREQHTKAYNLPHQVFEFVKKHRLKKIEEVQEEILIKKQQQRIGVTYQAICDKLDNNCPLCKYDENKYILRTEYESVGVDTVCYVQTNKKLEVGEFYNLKITGINGIDLVGKIVG